MQHKKEQGGYDRFTLSNGIEVIHKRVDSPVAHCGLFINAGSRDELPDEQGLAHFVEHMLFKGTTRRKPYHILSRLDGVGGEINAWTTKEETCVYASFLAPYYPRALELILDIVFRSTFPPKEVEKEKDVIVEEIASYKDNPSEQIFDDFEDMIFAGHPIGRNILGTEESVYSFTAEHARTFVERQYQSKDMVLSSVGDISTKKLHYQLEKALSGQQNEVKQSPERQAVLPYHPGKIILSKETHQTHCIIGNRAYSIKDEAYYPMLLLNNLLGGPALNNRLNLNIRERYGFAYHIESFYNAYSDTGVFGVYLGTDRQHISKSISLIEKELKSLCDKPLGSMQLHRAKKQLTGQMFLHQDSNLNLMLGAGKAQLIMGDIESAEEIIQQIENITSAQMQEVASEIFASEKQSVLVYRER